MNEDDFRQILENKLEECGYVPEEAVPPKFFIYDGNNEKLFNTEIEIVAIHDDETCLISVTFGSYEMTYAISWNDAIKLIDFICKSPEKMFEILKQYHKGD